MFLVKVLFRLYFLLKLLVCLSILSLFRRDLRTCGQHTPPSEYIFLRQLFCCCRLVDSRTPSKTAVFGCRCRSSRTRGGEEAPGPSAGNPRRAIHASPATGEELLHTTQKADLELDGALFGLYCTPIAVYSIGRGRGVLRGFHCVPTRNMLTSFAYHLSVIG